MRTITAKTAGLDGIVTADFRSTAVGPWVLQPTPAWILAFSRFAAWRMDCLYMPRNADTQRWLGRASRMLAEVRSRRANVDPQAGLDRLELRVLAVVRECGTAFEARDHFTRGHCDRLAEYACALAAMLGVDRDALAWVRLGAFLHDIGKVVVPAEILNKPGRLTDEERRIVERHPAAGVELLFDMSPPDEIMAMVRSHHERWDGHGYPDGLRAERIPIVARVLCVADVYDALTNDRPYRRAVDRATALRIMSRDVGRIFDPRAFAMFASLGATLDELARLSAPRRISTALRARAGIPGEMTEARILTA